MPAPAPVPVERGSRHLDRSARVTRRTVRNVVTFSGIAVVATGVAVAAGVVQAPQGAVNLADSLTPTAPKHPVSAAADLQHRSSVVVSRSSDRRASRDPAKQAALGLSSGPAVSGRESLTTQSPQSIAQALLPTYGWSASEMSCLLPLWMGESGWRINAENASSGAYGIPQSLPGSKMASIAPDWRTNPVTQIKWGLGYIQERYGSPCGAWGFKQGHGWY